MKLSPTIIVIAVIVVLVLLFGGYILIRKSNTSQVEQETNQQQIIQPTVSSASSSPQVAANETTVILAEENKSRESGTATLKEENGKTTVALSLTGFVQGVSQPAHIHVGACPGVGAVKYPLTSVVNGSSVTVLPLTLADLRQGLPLAINVHKTAKEINNYTACGELFTNQTPSQMPTKSPVSPTIAPQTNSGY
jgi:hypothetical protein